MKQIVRVLHVFGRLDVGGAESRTIDIYKNINREFVQFDFLVHTDEIGFYEPIVNNLGGKIYRVPRFRLKTALVYIKALNKFFKQHPEYNIVHGHILSTAFIYQWIAKRNGVKYRIAHSRNGNTTHLSIENLIKEVFKRLARFFVTDRFAVSKIAGESAYGRKAIKKNLVKIIPNAIESKKYIYNEKKREDIRNEFKFNNKFVVGHIGRFHVQKNHDFLLKIFKSILKINNNSVLLLIGDGEEINRIKKLSLKMNLQERIIFTGVRSDVPALLQAVDIIIFPSFFEGLPGVILEAQAAGVPSLISDSVTKEVKITDLVMYCSLNKSSSYWAKAAVDFYKSKNRRNTQNEIVDSGFDIKTVSKWYQKFYKSLI